MSTRDPTLRRIAPLLLIPAIWLVWHMALPGGFIFDDFPNLVRASGWKADSLSPRALLDAMNSGLTSDGGRPLSMLSFAINHATTGLDPWWLKATSLALHAINGVLVALLVHRVLAARPLPSSTPLSLAPTAWLIAFAWAAHPVQASTVAYTVQRMEIGAATGVLLSLLSYVTFRRRQLAGDRAWPFLVLAAATWAVGLGFKESAAIAPALAVLVEWICFGFRNRSGMPDRMLIGAFATGGLAALAAFIIMVLPLTSAAAYAPRAFDATGRTSTQFPVLCHYLALIFWPASDTFRFYYDDFPVSLTPWHDARTILSIAAILAAVLGAWALRRRWPLVTFGTAWFFACHAITSSPIPLELAFEHRNYLALLGPMLVIASLIATATKRLHGDARLTLAATVTLAISALGAIQGATWGNPAKLALTLENRAPGSARAAYGFATQMVEAAHGDPSSPAWSLGMGTLQRASHLPSASPLIPQAIIVLSGQQGTPPPAGTWDQFRRLLLQRQLGPEGIGSLYAVIQCRVSGTCQLQDDELLATLLQVIAANPRNARLHTLYANVAWNILGDRELAIRMQREAVALSGSGTSALLGLAEFLLASGEPDAIAEGRNLLESIRRNPTSGRTSSALSALEARYPASPAHFDDQSP